MYLLIFNNIAVSRTLVGIVVTGVLADATNGAFAAPAPDNLFWIGGLVNNIFY